MITNLFLLFLSLFALSYLFLREATRDLGLVILQGATLGGGTVINYTTSFATPEPVRDEWAREHGLPHFTAPEFARSLDAVARRLGVNTDHAAPSGRDRVLIRGLERLGWHHGLLPRNVRPVKRGDPDYALVRARRRQPSEAFPIQAIETRLARPKRTRV